METFSTHLTSCWNLGTDEHTIAGAFKVSAKVAKLPCMTHGGDLPLVATGLRPTIAKTSMEFT